MRRFAAVVVVAAVACATAAATSSPLAGAYQTKVTGKGAQLNGTWLLSFSPNGAYAVVKEPNTNTVLIGGSSTTSGNKLVMVDKSGPLSCTGASATGKYTWSKSGKMLRLTKTHDTCGGRPLVLAGGSWTKVR